MNADIISRLEKIGAEVLALAADLKRFGPEPLGASKAELAIVERKFGSQTRTLVETLALFGVDATVLRLERGLIADRIVFTIPPGTRCSAVTSLKDNLMGACRTTGVRIEAPVWGENALAVEIPHDPAKFEEVSLKALLKNGVPEGCGLPLFIGKTNAGADLVVDLSTLPHLIVAGAAGQGKTVLLNSIVCGLASNYSPDEVQFILYDDKMVEFAGYNALPHLAMPVITDCCRFPSAMRRMVDEMDRRLKTFAAAGCRNIKEYNLRGRGKVPYIVIIADEIADMMARVGKDVLPSVSRLTARARAAGIHLILSTQRPDAKVLPGELKANVPGRIAFRTASSVDSRTIIDETGAEDLVGRGDMLIRGINGRIVRAQGAIIRDPDIAPLVEKAEKKYKVEPLFKSLEVTAAEPKPTAPGPSSDEEDLERAIEEIRKTKRASTAHFQRRLGWGYNHAAKIIDLLEMRGMVAPQVRAGSRTVYFDKIPPKAKDKKGKRK